MRISDWSSDVCSSDLEILDPKSRQLRREMESATQYAQWRDAAAELDRREGLDQWQAEESGDEYDWRLIRSRLRQIRQYREEHDIAKLIHHLRQGLPWNVSKIGRPPPYARPPLGPKHTVRSENRH